MDSFFGRNSELATLEHSYSTAIAQGRPRLVFIRGDNGIGKTALIAALLDRVKPSGPIVQIRADRLYSLLPDALIPAMPAGSIVVIDDAHFAPPELFARLEEAMRRENGVAFAVVAATHEIDGLPQDDATVELSLLSDETIERIVRERAADATPAQRQNIVRWSAGSPHESVVLTALREQDASAARAIARFIAALQPAARALAQMLALIGSPVDERFAQALMPEPRELTAARDALAPLLARDRAELAFDHVLVESAVVETVAMKIPLHRRIISALERRGTADIRDRVILLEQFLGSTDRARSQESALDLAFEALRQHARNAQLWASERHMELGEPPDERFIAFYTQYVRALIEERAFERAQTVASHAFSAAQQRHLVDAVVLASLLIEAQWKFDRKDAARATYERLSAAFSDPSALAALARSAPWLHV
jgi:hypothetical protein